jgi:hypothetical protein
MTLPTGGIVRLVATGDVNNEISWVNTFYFRKTSTGGEDEFTIANDFTTNLMAAWRACQDQHNRWIATEYKQLFPDVGLVQELGTTTPNAGTQVTPGTGPFPACCAQHIILRTGLSGRQNHGRLYLTAPGYAGSAPASPLYWSGPQVAAAQAFVGAIFTRYNGTAPAIGFQWGVWSYVHSGPADPSHPRRGPWAVPHFNPVTVATAYAGIRTQRRREAPRGT